MSWPWPIEMLKYVDPASISCFLAKASTSETISTPGDKIKYSGVSGVESSYKLSNTWYEFSCASHCTKSLPFGKELEINVRSAATMRSGRNARTASSFRKGFLSSSRQSSGSFSVSGTDKLNHSPEAWCTFLQIGDKGFETTATS